MGEEYKIVFIEEPVESVLGIIGRGLRAYSKQQTDDDNCQRLCYAIYAPDDTIVGGALGELYWGWFHLESIWIQDDLRGRGYGSHLLKAIENEARQRGANHVFLNTFSFQAPKFYKQHGYQVFDQLRDFPPGNQRDFLTKQLYSSVSKEQTMKSWKDFSSEEPEISTIGKNLLFNSRVNIGYAFFATLRKDGAPQLHPISVILSKGHLYVIIPNSSPKYDDLIRDGRYALQAFPPTLDEESGEFYLAGCARQIQDGQILQSLAEDADVVVEWN